MRVVRGCNALARCVVKETMKSFSTQDSTWCEAATKNGTKTPTTLFVTVWLLTG
jgi:hypothetical protein